jgi:hypothetical protein
MNGLGIITFLSDFGRDSGYVAACEAVVAGVQPHARVLHISHEVAVGEWRRSAHPPCTWRSSTLAWERNAAHWF